jgi:hypothetical protein
MVPGMTGVFRSLAGQIGKHEGLRYRDRYIRKPFSCFCDEDNTSEGYVPPPLSLEWRNTNNGGINPKTTVSPPLFHCSRQHLLGSAPVEPDQAGFNILRLMHRKIFRHDFAEKSLVKSFYLGITKKKSPDAVVRAREFLDVTQQRGARCFQQVLEG